METILYHLTIYYTKAYYIAFPAHNPLDRLQYVYTYYIAADINYRI